MIHYLSKHSSLRYHCFLVIFACLIITPPAIAVEIIAFGDSITAGTGSEFGGYPARLQQLLESEGKPVHIYNLGTPGERTHQGVQRISHVLDTIHADVILIMEGTNDIRSGFPLQTTKLNLQLMIDSAKAKGVIPILSTLTPSDQNNSEVLIPNKYNPMIRELAKQNGLILVDQYAAVEQVWASLNDDGIHPNDNGYLYLAKAWDQTLGDMISPTGKFEDAGQFKVLLILLVTVICYFIYRVVNKRIKLPATTTFVPQKLRKNS